MLRILKMDLRRLFKTRAMYVSMAILMAIILITAGTVLYMTSRSLRELANIAKSMMEEDPQGMNIDAATTYVQLMGGEEQLKVMVRQTMDIMRLMQVPFAPNMVHLMIAVIAALFASKDYTSGYLKNLLCVPRMKQKWLIGKAAAMLVAAVMVYLAVFLAALIGTTMLGNSITTTWGALFLFLGKEMLVSLALCAIVLFILTLTQNKTAALVLGMVISVNMQMIIFFLIDSLNFLPFKLREWGLMSQASRLLSGGETPYLVVTALVFMAAGFGISWWAITRRDLKM